MKAKIQQSGLSSLCNVHFLSLSPYKPMFPKLLFFLVCVVNLLFKLAVANAQFIIQPMMVSPEVAPGGLAKTTLSLENRGQDSVQVKVDTSDLAKDKEGQWVLVDMHNQDAPDLTTAKSCRHWLSLGKTETEIIDIEPESTTSLDLEIQIPSTAKDTYWAAVRINLLYTQVGGASSRYAFVVPVVLEMKEPELSVKTPISLDLGNGITLEFVHIPAGTFDMGSKPNEKFRDDDEGPVRSVQITQAFYLGKYEITQSQYTAVMGENPSYHRGSNLPVESVSWDDAIAFCKCLSQKIGRSVRLPTEAEWEYACRAGTDTGYYWCNHTSFSQTFDYAWSSQNGIEGTHGVGQKKPNQWGLYDMAGNVWEWCADWYADSYEKASFVDPKGPGSGKYRVLRGGSWDYSAVRCLSANRSWDPPSDRRSNYGFRVALDP